MPQLLIELFSEEIPARMQKRAEEDLARLLKEALDAARIPPQLYEDGLLTFSTPRRLGLVVDDLPSMSLALQSERKGPKVGAPEAAIQGFVKSAGLQSIQDAHIIEDPKGDFYVARRAEEGRPVAAVLQEIIPKIVHAFPWPKSMRSGESDLTWVRPLQNILCLFDGKHVPISVDTVPSEAKTWGHRFHAPAGIEPKGVDDYFAKLRAAKVETNREERKRIIGEGALRLCNERGVEWISDQGLLDEVAGLVEWPVTLLGDMDPAFLDLPGEVIRLSMRTHQKYFAVRDPKSGKLAPHFVTVANVEAKDGGKAIAAGNARVLSARLNDARFFWDSDRKTPYKEHYDKLGQVVFHAELGTQLDRQASLAAMSRFISREIKRPELAKAAQDAGAFCKFDLMTQLVGEFPELQGKVGRQIALEQGEPAIIADAVEEHYWPTGADDPVATKPVSVIVGLADRLFTLAGFWWIGEKPTGSRDPYALRRAALGVVRLLTTNGVRLSLRAAILEAMRLHRANRIMAQKVEYANVMSALRELGFDPSKLGPDKAQPSLLYMTEWTQKPLPDVGVVLEELVAFLADRLKVQLRDQGKRHDLVDAVFALGDDDLVRIVARVEALDAFLKTEDGANLLAGSKRATKLLADEEKKGKWSAEEAKAQVDASKLAEPAEKALHAALESAVPTARSAVEKEDFASAMTALSQLRAPVDQFFEKVLVNAEDAMLRRNRLLLLSRLREALSAVADFSKIEG